MNRTINTGLLCVILYLLIAAAQLDAAPVPIPKPPMINAKSYILLDHNTGNIIAEENADERNDPASITKLMTAYIVYKAMAEGRFDKEITPVQVPGRKGQVTIVDRDEFPRAGVTAEELSKLRPAFSLCKETPKQPQIV